MRSNRAITIIPLILAALSSISTTARAATILVGNYGAIPNDTGDDTAAINNAINAAAAGDVVLLAAGTYRISTSLTMKSHVSLQGDAQGSTVLFTGTVSAPLVRIPGGSTAIAVHHLTLDGGLNGSAAHGIEANNSTFLDLHDLTIRNFSTGTLGINFTGDVRDSRITDNTITNMGVGTEWGGGIRVSHRSHRNQILRNTITDTGRGGIFCDNDSTDTIIKGNHISGTATGRPKVGIDWPEALGVEVWGGCARSIIEDNVVDAWLSVDRSDDSAVRNNRVTGTPGRWAFAGIELAGASNVVFTKNRVEAGAQIGISVSSDPVKNYVYWGRNTILRAANWGIQLQGDGGGARYHYFYDTTFKDTLPKQGNDEVRSPEWPSGHGFRINDNAQFITVERCTIENNPYAIQLVGSTSTLSDVSFLDNRIVGNGQLYDQSGGPFNGFEWTGNTVPSPLSSTPQSRPPTDFLITGALQPGTPVGFSVVPSTGIVAALWDFGDGIPSRATGSASHTYAVAGTYEVTAIVWRAGGVATRVQQKVRIGPGPSRIDNLSFRAVAGPGAQTLIVGLANAGGDKQVLVRGVGPGLAQFGVSNVLPNPALTLFRDDTAIAANDDWQTPNGSAVAAAGSQVAAFTMQPLDAALVAPVNARSYTAHVSGSGSGVALAEIYDLDPAGGASRLVNLSGRGQVGTGDNVLFAGFHVDGARSRRVLVRGVGPGLVPFGLPGTLADPLLELHDAQGTVLRRNAGWSSHPLASQIASVAAQVSAFPLTSGSHDAALLVTLEPGAYTVHLRGESGGTGLGLIEIYDADDATVSAGINARIAAMYSLQNIARCGDGSCVVPETCSTCQQDCGACPGGSGPGSGGPGPGSGPEPGTCTCNDSNPCTQDWCTPSGCSFVPIDCDDHDPCTNDSCSPSTGACISVPNGTCSPPNPCAGVNCDDGNGCTVDSCVNGQCRHEGNSCDDGNDCTVDWCSAHTCFNAPISACGACDDGDPCTDDIYESGMCHNPPNGTCPPPDPCGGCDNSDPCTVTLCIAFHCVSFPNGACNHDPCEGVVCDDGDACTADWCSEGDCHHDDNGSCGGGGGGDPCDGVTCDDSDACSNVWCSNGDCYSEDNGSCGGGGGGGDPCDGVTCDDSNPCENVWCSDGACYSEDNGSCGGGGGGDPCDGVTCDDSNPCENVWCSDGACYSEDNGSCGGGGGGGDPCDGVNCDDGNPCSDKACSDGACYGWDNGSCSGGGGDPCDGVTCDDSDPCSAVYCDGGSCNSYDNGSCSGGDGGGGDGDGGGDGEWEWEWVWE